jgi:hypothetical protein
LEDADEFHVDQAEELGDADGATLPQESPAAIDQFRGDMRDPAMMQRIQQKRRVGSQQTVEAIRRATMARGDGINEELVQHRLTQTSIPAFRRLAAAQAMARLERDRATLASMPVLPGESEAVREARAVAAATAATTTTPVLAPTAEPTAAQAISASELQRLLVLDPFTGLSRDIQVGLLDLGDMRSVFMFLQRRIFIRESNIRHENALEVIMSARCAGAMYEEMTRVTVPSRLALALDPVHYSDYIVRGAVSNDAVMIGGHEHFDGRSTSLIIMKFWTVRRNKKNNANVAIQKTKRATRGTDVIDEVNRERQGVDVERHDEEADIDTYDDTDDYYTGGSDCKDLKKHFLCCVRMVFVEARECLHTDETGHHHHQPQHDQSPSAATTAAQPTNGGLDDIFAAPAEPAFVVEQPPEFRYAEVETAEERAAAEAAAPNGCMHVSQQLATQLAGKYRYRQLMAWLNGPKRPRETGALGDSRQLGPLCFRAYNVSNE